MDRRVLVSAVVVLSLAFGCRRSAPDQAASAPQPAPPPPPPAMAEPAPAPTCTPFDTPQIDIKIAQDATASPDCVVFEKKVNTKIVWTVDPPATGLTITWKTECPGGVKPDKFPPPPDCTGTTCVLEDKHLASIVKKTELCYAVEVSFKDKQPAKKDPKLIVNP